MTTVPAAAEPGIVAPIGAGQADLPAGRKRSLASRHAGIEAGRIVGALLVIIIHSGAASQQLLLVCQIAVPFFFVASGYFLRLPERVDRRMLTQPLLRIVPIYLSWMAIYYGAVYLLSGSAPRLHAIDLIKGGKAFHLWFLPALAFALVVVPLSYATIGARLSGVVWLLLASISLAFGTYKDVLGLPELPDRALVAPLLVFAGTIVARSDLRLTSGAALALLVVSLACLAGEEWLVMSLAHARFISHAVSIFVSVSGVAAFLLARSLPTGHVVEALGRLGRYSLGVYLSHLLFIWIFAAVWSARSDPLQGAMLILASFCAALALTALMQRVPGLRAIVR